jgi:cyclopropane-fatty-acyl-phospholipid synthase
MSKNHLEARAQEILSSADVKIGGDRPWDLVVHNEDFYSRVLRQGSLGLGESYMDGWWDCQELDQFFHKVLSAGLDRKALVPWSLVVSHLKAWLFNPQDKTRAAPAARRHYDLGNDLFQGMLDKRLVYTSGNWERASNLDEAQEAKLDFVCRKLDLQPGMKILDIGCGWGSFAKFAAEKYGAEVVGITVSREQCALGQQLCDCLPIEIRLQDYREVRGSFDRIVSLGMFEHVGYKKLPNVYGGGAPLVANRRPVLLGHHRGQPVRPLHRRLDRQVHLSRFHAAFDQADWRGDGRIVCHGRVAQLGELLR